MSWQNPKYAATAAGAAASAAPLDSAPSDRCRLESQLFELLHADCAGCSDPDCPAGRRQRTETAVAAGQEHSQCARCRELKPRSAFSAAQRKLRGRRQCRRCLEPACAVCGMQELRPEHERIISPLVVKRPQPAAEVLVHAHYPCAVLLGGQLDQTTDPPSIAGLSGEMCALLASRCDHCHLDGAVVRCGGCSRAFHEGCGCRRKVAPVFPVLVDRCRHCAPEDERDGADAASGEAALDEFVSEIRTSTRVDWDAVMEEVESDPLPAAAAAAVNKAIEPGAPAAAGTSAASSSSASASVSADSSSSSASSSTGPAAAGLKKCALCQASLPESDYSASQLKTKAKRQCKACVAALQSAKARLPPSQTLAIPKDIGPRFVSAGLSLNDMRGPEQLAGAQQLSDLLFEVETAGIRLHPEPSIVTRIMTVLRSVDSHELGLYALLCVLHWPALHATLLDAGVVPAILRMLQHPGNEYAHVMCVKVLDRIADLSSESCDALLAAGALPVLLGLIRRGIPADLDTALAAILKSLLPGRPLSEAAGLIAHYGAVLKRRDTQPDLVVAALETLQAALAGCADCQKGAWTVAILSSAPGIPRRLVELASGDACAGVCTAEMSVAALALMGDMFRSHVGQLQQLVDCGLFDQLHPLLCSGEEEIRLHAARLCNRAARCKGQALRLVERGPLIRRMVELLGSTGHMLKYALAFVGIIVLHQDREMARRMIDEYRALPPLVTALRRSCDGGDEAAMADMLNLVGALLLVGDEVAKDDERGVNPYIEPIDWLGVFEIADPLQSHANENIAQAATRVFGYFIPNDCE